MRRRILFICQGDFSIASVKQALGFAVQLKRKGWEVMFNVSGDPATHELESVPLERDRVHFRRWYGPILDRDSRRLARGFSPDIVHVFNPRISTVAVARAMRRDLEGAATVVHWEDDEFGIRHGVSRRSAVRRAGRLGRRVLRYAYPPHGAFVTPDSLAWVRENADACDALTAALAEVAEETVGIRAHVVHPIAVPAPAAPPEAPALPREVREKALVGYTGTVHAESVHDFRLACEGVALVRKTGADVALVHAGASVRRFDLDRIAMESGLSENSYASLGYIPGPAVPALLRRCRVLVQPGWANDYNRFRLPAKVQSYLESGVPTITFAVGFGELLTDGVDALKLYGYDAEELAIAIRRVTESPDLASRLGDSGRRRARELFDPEANVAALLNCYEDARSSALARGTSPGSAWPVS